MLLPGTREVNREFKAIPISKSHWDLYLNHGGYDGETEKTSPQHMELSP